MRYLSSDIGKKRKVAMDTIHNGHARRQAVKRSEILAAATKLFFKEGYGRVSMDAVLAKVGGSKRTLYKHFRSKDDLFTAIVTNVSDRALAALRPPLDGGDIRETLITMGEQYLTVLLSPDGLALYRTMVSEASHFPELAQTFFTNGPGRASRNLADFFQERKVKGLLKIDSPLLAAEQFLGMVRGDVHLASVLLIRKPTKPLIRKSVRQAVETFLCGAVPDLCKG